MGNVDITALEIDSKCFVLLQHRVKRQGKEWERAGASIQCYNDDSRSYNPPGNFDVVVSSFADHHIKPKDKLRYFSNVQRNMRDGAIFVVGDEFLPEHDSTDLESRSNALTRYHEHIIEIAREEGHEVLVKLEQAALTSGLEQIGDFKLSCSEYEAETKEAGLHLDLKEKIGPLDDDSVGGVFVYRFIASS